MTFLNDLCSPIFTEFHHCNKVKKNNHNLLIFIDFIYSKGHKSLPEFFLQGWFFKCSIFFLSESFHWNQKDFLFDCRRFFDSTLSNTCIANTVTDTYINLMIKTERTNWFYDIQEVHFVKTSINCISKTKTLRRNFISIIFNSNDVWIQKKTNYDKKIDYTSSYKKSLKKNNILHNYKTNRNKLNSWNSVTIRKCLMLIANLNRIPVENLSSMITTDFFNILGSKTPASEVFWFTILFSLHIFFSHPPQMDNQY